MANGGEAKTNRESKTRREGERNGGNTEDWRLLTVELRVGGVLLHMKKSGDRMKESQRMPPQVGESRATGTNEP